MLASEVSVPSREIGLTRQIAARANLLCHLVDDDLVTKFADLNETEDLVEKQNPAVGHRRGLGGSCPADDIDIFMHFPDGFELFDEDDCEKEPEAPKAPRKPRSILEEAAAGLSIRSFGYSDHLHSHLDYLSSPVGPSNVSGPKIKRTNSYDVKVSVRRAKHGIEEPLDTIYLTFESSAMARSFAIDYAIHASNLPSHVTGTLNVIV